MEKDPNKYNLEAFFRNQLENYHADDNGWNIPPDDIWQEVQPRIRRRARYAIFRSPGKYLPLIGLLLLTVLGFISYLMINNNRAVDRLATELESVKKDLSDIRQLETRPNNSELQTSTTILSDPELPITDSDRAEYHHPASDELNKAITPGDPIYNQTGRSAEDLNTGAPTGSQNYERQQLPEKSTLRNPVAPEAGNPPPLVSAGPEPVQEQQAVFTALQPLPPSIIPELNKPEAELGIDPVREARRPLKGIRALKFSLGAMQTERFLDTLSANFENNVQHQYSGLSLGLSLEWPLSQRWSVESGIVYAAYFAHSRQDRHLHYSESSKDFPGLEPNDFLIKSRVHSAIGHASAQMIFTLDPTASHPHRRINATIHSKTRAHYLGVPLIINYRITQGRLGLLLRGGLLGSSRVHQRFHVQNVETDNTHIQFKSSEPTSVIEDVQSLHLQYLLGVGLDYQFAPRYGVYIEPTFSRSLTPVTIIENVRIGWQSIGLRGGLKLHF